MPAPLRRTPPALLATLLAAGLAGCATTTVTIDPPSVAAACDPSARARVLWAPQWRADQKDVPDREAAAEAGLRAFLHGGGCFAQATLDRVAADRPPVQQAAESWRADPAVDRVLVVRVRELGPVLRLFDSPALVRGGTEVVLDLAVVSAGTPATGWRTRWRHGGPGVVRGVGGLPQDLQRALEVALRPPPAGTAPGVAAGAAR